MGEQLDLEEWIMARRKAIDAQAEPRPAKEKAARKRAPKKKQTRVSSVSVVHVEREARQLVTIRLPSERGGATASFDVPRPGSVVRLDPQPGASLALYEQVKGSLAANRDVAAFKALPIPAGAKRVETAIETVDVASPREAVDQVLAERFSQDAHGQSWVVAYCEDVMGKVGL